MRREWIGQATRRSGTPARGFYPSIINHPSSIINQRAFTLIELLVVISIVVLLVALLLPSLQRVRKRAKAVGCEANLHQWGILYAGYTSENDGYLPAWEGPIPGYQGDDWWGSWRWRWEMLGSKSTGKPGMPDRASFAAIEDLLRCPMAARPRFPSTLAYDGPTDGGTFLAWTWGFGYPGPGWYWRSSYAANNQAHSWRGDKSDPSVDEHLRFMWMTSAVKNAATVPVFFDSVGPLVDMYDDKKPPPECDAIPTRLGTLRSFPNDSVCINRHDGGVNSLFMDWSVRKVGLKELWTLKWHTQYNTRGPWTKAGGVKPGDWPQWMRGFKDY